MKNKKGWIKIVEAFIAIGLFAGLLFLVIQNNPIRQFERDFIEDKQTEILNAIQINDSLRNDVFSVGNFDLSSNDSAFPESLTNFTQNNLYSNLECYLKVCPLTSSCIFETQRDEIYAKDVLITTDSNTYNPRKLKMFCLK